MVKKNHKRKTNPKINIRKNHKKKIQTKEENFNNKKEKIFKSYIQEYQKKTLMGKIKYKKIII